MKRRAAAFLLPMAALSLLGASPPPAGVDVTITVSNMRSTDGKVFACLAPDKAVYPDCRKPGGTELRMPAADAARFTFHGVAPGRYAIALLHDENDNGKLDKALMIPKEGFGFSRDAPVTTGRPPFSAAAFDVGTDDVKLPIKMRYIL